MDEKRGVGTEDEECAYLFSSSGGVLNIPKCGWYRQLLSCTAPVCRPKDIR